MNSVERMRERLGSNRLLLAPMAGYTDAIFRGICKEFGCGLTCTEMVSAQGIAYNNDKTLDYLEISDAEGDAAVQLFGSDPAVIAEQAARVEEMLGSKLAAIDLNMGCPVPKVVKKGEGSALMKDVPRAAQIVSAVRDAVGVPVTVKFRRGFEAGEDIAAEFGLAMQDAGASACCVHGRFASDFYHGGANWDSIARVKEALEIPIVASGDLFDHHAIADCLEQTGADAVMVARGAIGNSWIFEQARSFLETDEEPSSPGLGERLDVARTHARRLGERDAHSVIKMRSFIGGYFKGMPGAAKIREGAMHCDSIDEFERYFDEIERLAIERGYIDGVRR